MSTRIVVFLFGLSLTRGLIYSAVIPPWQAPDEPQHFEYVRLMSDKRRLVTGKDMSPALRDEIMASMYAHSFWRFAPISPDWSPDGDPSQQLSAFWANTESQLYQPPLYYAVAASILSATRLRDVTNQLYVTRLVSVLMATGVVVFAYVSIRALFPNDLPLQVVVPSFILFLPMHTHITSSANNGNLAELAASATVCLVTISLKRGLSLARAVLLGLALVAGFYSKRTFFFAVPLALLAIPLSLWLNPPKFSGKRALGVAAGLVGTGLAATLQWQREKLLGFWSGLYFNLGFNHYLDPSGMLEVLPQRLPVHGRTLLQGFWARFGWWAVGLESAWYWLILSVSFLALVGASLFFVRLARGHSIYANWQRVVLGLYALSVIVIVSVTVSIFLAINATGDGIFKTASPQGRLLFPAIIPIATLFMIGIREMIPAKWHARGLWLGLFSLALFDLLSLVRYIVPFYYG